MKWILSFFKNIIKLKPFFIWCKCCERDALIFISRSVFTMLLCDEGVIIGHWGPKILSRILHIPKQPMPIVKSAQVKLNHPTLEKNKYHKSNSKDQKWTSHGSVTIDLYSLRIEWSSSLQHTDGMVSISLGYKWIS